MTGRACWTATVMVVAAALAAALTGCRRDPGPETLRQAWSYSVAQRADDGIPLVKAYLAAHPDDAAAHYVLGSCCLHRSDVNTTMAKGEFETALFYFGKNGRLGIFAPDMTAEQFQSAAHRDIALALMRALYEGGGQGLPGRLMYPVLDLALQHVHEGLRFDPTSSFLQEMGRSLEDLRSGRPSPAPPLQHSAKPGEITI